ncbi:MAG: tRNA (adenosine(37)-N6)-dimethylallyltransferase MiaA [Acidobacteria bacterium]|nr:MAG: tRNA (adenosine(37)-N6)-dimethylallyltransferase MiaA [Acidobacteriota bacterium]REK02052.1 MAG: tRNA (adenosine(37)-N6)-dimethylallyltransferase MiaA [Acidobacteriota bacterium]REK15010.1 MAG: tRNA (adenosine(37)-N6)-dimethylallyltransferase MiaA [Acidobacteriota bacterium]REK45724.1 MAG: tRNA (adenosine(37)-N6)-dimethylallyltransferase MiaA [Acidobacteriota bacterium]
MTPQDIIPAIVGPTASGKTELGVKLALHFGNGEVISCDSVQIYKEIEIATAKPTEEEKKGVPHHLIDYVSPHTNYTAADWAYDAAGMIKKIEGRGGRPIIVGGTGFYLRTLMRPLFDSPKTDVALRQRLVKLNQVKGPAHLHRMLARLDPGAASSIPENDYVRTMRALEVRFQTGSPISELQPKRSAPPEFADRIRLFVLNPPRAELYVRIDRRAKRHFDLGLVEEVQQLLARGVPPDSNALGSHGYRRVREFLSGKRTLESAVEKTAQDVRNYAKRQFTWFRKEASARWIEGFGGDPSVFEELVRLIDP